MVEEKPQHTLPLWKLLILPALLIGLLKLFHLWFSEPVAWGISTLVTFIVFYETPPRIGSPPNFGKSVLWATASALLAFGLAKVL